LKFELPEKASTILSMIQELLSTAAVASLPLVEQRLAIPLGFFSWDLTIWQAVLAGTGGNIISVGFVLWLWPKLAQFARKHSPFCDRILTKIFANTRAKHSHNVKTWGNIFLIFFVMLPVPGSGGWSGSLVAWLFGFSYWRAMKLITIGLILGGIIIAIAIVGVDQSIQYFTEVIEEDLL